MITDAAQAEHILRTGQADVVLLARELLREPYWPLQAAKELGDIIRWPAQYLRAAPQGSREREPVTSPAIAETAAFRIFPVNISQPGKAMRHDLCRGGIRVGVLRRKIHVNPQEKLRAGSELAYTSEQ